MIESATSDRSSAFLVELQEQYYALTGEPLPTFTDDGIEFLAERVARGLANSESDYERRKSERYDFLRKVGAEVPSPYEDPIAYSAIKELSDEIHVAVDLLGLKLTSKPVIGTLPLHDINARTVLIPESTEHLVLFDSGLFTFFFLFSKAIAQAFPTVDDGNGKLKTDLSTEAIKNHVGKNPDVGTRFIQAVGGYLMGRPSSAPQYFASTLHNLISDYFINSLELFILGHEYGHVVAGHLSSDTPTAAMIPSSSNSPEALEFSWNQEYEADLYGAVLSIAAMNAKYSEGEGSVLRFAEGEGGVLRFAGSELFFGAVDIVDRAMSTIAFGHPESRRLSFTHPPALERRLTIRRSLPKIMSREAATLIVDMGEAIEDAIEALWQEAMPEFLKVYERTAGSQDA
jgi:hypothetical protein